MEDKIETSTDLCSGAAITSQRKAKKQVFKSITEMKETGPYCTLLTVPRRCVNVYFTHSW